MRHGLQWQGVLQQTAGGKNLQRQGVLQQRARRAGVAAAGGAPTAPVLVAPREKRGHGEEREKEEHGRERIKIKADVSRGEKNETADQSNPIRVKWVFHVPRKRKTLTKFAKSRKRDGIPRFERIRTSSVIF